MLKPITVFISSTCYDLMDLRAELKAELEKMGCVVRISEDPNSAFFVDPTADSIDSCIQNVQTSDAVVVVIDRRYGTEIEAPPYDGKSATHLEVDAALAAKKPLLYFIREQSRFEYQQLKRNISVATQWVEKERQPIREKWYHFVKNIFPIQSEQSNWVDSFKSSVDLKSLVRKRLMDRYPQLVLSSVSPEHAPFAVFQATKNAQECVEGQFVNLGPGPMIALKLGITIKGNRRVIRAQPALEEGERTTVLGRFPTIDESHRGVVFCEYLSRYRQHFRVEYEVVKNADEKLETRPDGTFYVEIGDVNGKRWVPVHSTE
jgi:hypothetical protein